MWGHATLVNESPAKLKISEKSIRKLSILVNTVVVEELDCAPVA